MKNKQMILAAATLSAVLSLGGLTFGEAASSRPLGEAPQNIKKIRKIRKIRKIHKISKIKKIRKVRKIRKIRPRRRHRRRERLG